MVWPTVGSPGHRQVEFFNIATFAQTLEFSIKPFLIIYTNLDGQFSKLWDQGTWPFAFQITTSHRPHIVKLGLHFPLRIIRVLSPHKELQLCHLRPHNTWMPLGWGTLPVVVLNAPGVWGPYLWWFWPVLPPGNTWMPLGWGTLPVVVLTSPTSR